MLQLPLLLIGVLQRGWSGAEDSVHLGIGNHRPPIGDFLTRSISARMAGSDQRMP